VGQVYIANLVGATPEGADTLRAGAAAFFELGGKEFEAALQTEEGQKRKLQKFVEENRDHYWVESYNDALKRFENEAYDEADLLLRVCRTIDPTKTKAYTQGAIALIRMDQMGDAMELVDGGLAIDPQEEKLLSLKGNLMRSSARELIAEAESEENADKLNQAVAIYGELLEREPDDAANLYYERGLAELSGAGILKANDEAAGVAMYEAAAEDFGKAADLVPPEGENVDFHNNCKFYIVQALTNAGKVEPALKAAREYLCLAPMDHLGWQFMVINLLDMEDQAGVVSSLMMKKSLDPTVGQEIPVDGAVDVAKGAVKTDLDANGKPDHVYTYTDDNTQIQTWIWLSLKKASIFTLPDAKAGEVSWCTE